MFEGGGRSPRAQRGRSRCDLAARPGSYEVREHPGSCRGSVLPRVWERESFGVGFKTHATLCDRHFEQAVKRP